MSVLLPAHDGSSVEVGRARGGRLQVAWWFPRANTPNCAIQARRLVQEWSALAGAGADLVGVSYDSVADLAAWAETLRCPFPLCSADVVAAEELGAARPVGDPWREAIPLRVAVIADDSGATVARWVVDDVHSFAEQVLSALNVRSSS